MRKCIIGLIIIFAISYTPEVSAQYQKIISNGLEVYYRSIGEGEPLLIIGGGPGDVSDRYLSLCELLSENNRCILVDQRGTGKSSPEVYDSTTISIPLTLEDFEAIRKKLKLNKWNVLGFSYGGYLASLYAHFNPSSVSSLVLLGSMGLNDGGFGHFIDNIISRLHPSDLEVCEYWSDSLRMALDSHHAIVEIIRARMPGYFFDRKKSLLVSQVMKDSDFNFELGKYIWPDIRRRNLDLAKMKPDFTGPVLILHGRQDPLGESVPQSVLRYYQKSKLIFVEKSGHYSWIEQPEKIKESIKVFLGKKKQKQK